MGWLSDIGDFFLGWLVPEQETKVSGAELTSASTEDYVKKVYGAVSKINGTIIFKRTNDADSDDIKNDLLHIIIVWSEAAEEILEAYVDDLPISVNSSPFMSSDGKRMVHARHFHNGMSGYNDPLLTQAGWRETDEVLGKACTYFRLEYHTGENAITQEPEFKADIKGTTSSNPAFHLRDYLKSYIYGKGLSDSFLNLTAFSNCEALADVDVENFNGSGVYRPLFTCNVALDTSDTVLENTNKLLKSMRAMMPVLNGKLTPIIEKDDPPVDLLITEQDIIKLGSIKNSSKSGRFNRVIVEYYDDTDGEGTLQQAVYPEPDSAEDMSMLAADNGFRLEKTFKRETCRNYYEALEEAKSLLRVSREQLRTTIELPKWATVLEVGDIVPVQHSFPGWTAAAFPTYGGKLFRIETTTESRDSVKLGVREHQPYIYDFFGEGNKPNFPDTGIDVSGPAIPTDLSVTPYYDNFKQVRVNWVSVSQQFQYQVLNQAGDVLEAGSSATNYVDIKGYALGNYRFRVRAVGGLGLVSGWAETPVIMQVPGVPDNIIVNPSNFEIEVIPSLNGASSYTQFRFSKTDISATEPAEPFRGPAHAYTFVGLTADTDVRIWVQSFNPLGGSVWTYIDTRTTNEKAALSDLLGIPAIVDKLDTYDPQIIEDLSEEVENLADIRPALNQEIANREALAEIVNENAGKINAVVEVDPDTGEIVSSAQVYAEQGFSEVDQRISAAEQAITQRVTSAQFEEEAVTFNNVEQTINGLDSFISLAATQQQIESNNTVSKANAAEVFIDGNTGTITQIVQSFNIDLSSLNTSIYDIQQQLGEQGISQQIAGLASSQIRDYEAAAALLDQIASEGANVLSQFEQNDSYGIAIEEAKLEIDPRSAMARNFSELQAASSSNNSLILAQSRKLSQVSSDVLGNAEALEAVTLKVNGVDSTLSSTVNRLDSVEITANNNSSAISYVTGLVENQQTGLSASYSLAQQAKTTADGAVQSITQISNDVSTAQGQASSALTLASGLNDELDTLRGRAQLAVNADGTTTLIQLDATPDISLIKLQAGKYAFTDSSGNIKIGWDTDAGAYEFKDGRILASLIEGSVIRGSKTESIGSKYMILKSGEKFGPDDLIEWYGPINSTTYDSGNKEVRYANIRKNNAVSWRDDDGNEYTEGTIITGTLTTSKQNTSLGDQMEVVTGSFGSNGDMIAVKCSFSIYREKSATSYSGQCPASNVATAVVRLYRENAQGAWVEVKAEAFSLNYQCNNATGSTYSASVSGSGSFTYFDGLYTTSPRNYKLTADIVTPINHTYYSLDQLNTQNLSILTQE